MSDQSAPVRGCEALACSDKTPITMNAATTENGPVPKKGVRPCVGSKKKYSTPLHDDGDIHIEHG